MKRFRPGAGKGPVYRQIKEWILKAVDGGEFAAGDPFASEVTLSRMAGVTRMTVRQATNELVAEGVLVREPGKRPRVAPKKVVAEFLELAGVSHYAERVGSDYVCRVLLAGFVTPEESVVNRLKVRRSDTVFCLERLRSLHGSCFGYEKTWINRALCPGIDGHDFSRESLYTVFRDEYDLVPSHSEGILDVMVAGGLHASLLGVRAGTPLLCVHRTVFTATDQPLQVNYEIYRGDKYRFAYKAGHRK